MFRRTTLLTVALLAVTMFGGVRLSAQVGLVRWVIGSGAAGATNGTQVMAGTIGQTLIGPHTTATMFGGFGFWYTLRGSVSGIREEYNHNAVTGATLQVYPNPVVDVARITVSLGSSQNVTLKVFDAVGRELQTLISGRREAGTTTVSFGVEDLPSGNYTLVLIAGPARHATTMQIVR